MVFCEWKNSSLNAKLYIYLLFIVALLLLLSEHNSRPDEGATINIAWQLLQGKTIYSQLFQEFISPGSGYLILYIWKLFGTYNYLIVKLSFIILVGLSAILFSKSAWSISKSNFRQNMALFTLIPTFCPTVLINHNTLSSLVAIWCLYLIIEAYYGKKNTFLYLFLAGITTALCLWFLQTKGLSVFGAIILSIFFFKIRPVQKFQSLLSYSVGFVVTLWILFFKFSVHSLIEALIIFPREIGYISANLKQLDYFILSLMLLILCCMVFYYIKSKNNLIIILFFFQLMLFLSFANNINLGHFSINIFPFLLIVLTFVKKNKIITEENILICVISYFAYTSFILIFLTLNIYNVEIFRTKKLFDARWDNIKSARNIYAGPFMPNLYYELGKENIMPMPNMQFCKGVCATFAIEQLKLKRPEYALVDLESLKGFGYTPDNPIDQYILTHYKYCRNIDDIQVYTLDKCE